MRTSMALKTTAVLLSITWSSLSSAQVPADPVLRDFALTGDVRLVVDGRVVEEAEIYQSQRAARFLILAPQLPGPILVSTRTQTVESVSLMSLARRDSGVVDVLADATLTSQGRIRLDGEQVAFTVAGQQLRLIPSPHLVGLQGREEMLRDPAWRATAREYAPDASSLAALRQAGGEVQVVVFFGSWSLACKRYVPLVLKVEEELDGAVGFSYRGLPAEDFSSEPEARKAGVTAVPTVIVLRAGTEVGRFQPNQWPNPEAGILALLKQD